MAYTNIREEELKNKVAQDYFDAFDCTKIIGNIDFCVTVPEFSKRKKGKQGSLFEAESLFWGEAKPSNRADIYESFVQLILTIGKERTFDKHMPPAFLGAFDAEKIAFIPYNSIQEIFYQNDFNWKVAPSDYKTKEFRLVYEKVKTTIENDSLLFIFNRDDKELHTFVKMNFIVGKASTSKIKIDKNNFTVIYNKWLTTVKPTIAVNWDIAKKNGIIDGDFYLADLLSRENETLKEKLYVLLKIDHYEMDRKLDDMGMFSTKTTSFTDKQKAHTQFWNKYERPPKEEYWDYIVERRDLLVPQAVRERKGSFFTPQIWVELSQKYITDVFGEDWQDEYFIWDCAAGTGNLLTGLTNKYNIWASTLDTQDVDVMHERIETMNINSAEGDGANLLHDHVFQFDFLNDDFSKLPNGLQDIINDDNKRKKLIIYINPPYAEATQNYGKNTKKAVEQNKTNERYATYLKQANREVFAQFFTRIYFEIKGCKLASFSKLKILSGQHFIDFRNFFLAKLLKAFACPANTFDNVKGEFPIGFMIWDISIIEKFEKIVADIYDKNGGVLGTKCFFAYDNSQYINDWIKPFRAKKNDTNIIGKFPFVGNDFQTQAMVKIVNSQTEYIKSAGQFLINANNLIKSAIYFAVRQSINGSWLNDRDQFLFPNEGWKADTEFHNDCLAYTVFNNNIQSKYGVNHWIPFKEHEVNSRDKFESNFMANFIVGKLKEENRAELFDMESPIRKTAFKFSLEAKALFDAGRELWRYYHKQPGCNVNASLYDIREHFQGRNEKGKMNNNSDDETYMKRIKELRERTCVLGRKIEPKIYEYGFLKK
jgi:hypothetical protein